MAWRDPCEISHWFMWRAALSIIYSRGCECEPPAVKQEVTHFLPFEPFLIPDPTASC